MKGVVYRERKLYGIHYCDICGKEIKEDAAWIYRRGSAIFHFCGDRPDCLNKFIELNNLHGDGGEE